jgi:hypothetical protein
MQVMDIRFLQSDGRRAHLFIVSYDEYFLRAKQRRQRPELCYNNEIRCLRVPTAAERLSPTLIDVFVRGGYRHAGSQKINLPEAEAIVAEIKRIVNDPAFEKRTLGVVSLLGSEQARIILEMLVSGIGEEKILKHQIRCGDAMTFQGREATHRKCSRSRTKSEANRTLARSYIDFSGVITSP